MSKFKPAYESPVRRNDTNIMMATVKLEQDSNESDEEVKAITR
jgi:hypothetical protein